MSQYGTPKVGRRALLKSVGATLLAPAMSTPVRAAQLATQTSLRARWIWYPGQLAAYRHSRLVRQATERCVHVGYPANFRQPVPAAYFRRKGKAPGDIAANWAAPVGRVRVWLGATGFDITLRAGTFKAGSSDITVQIDFAQSLPCLFMEAGDFSTGEDWEASLDGKTWVAAEVSDGGDFATLPDAEHEHTVSYPVAAALPAQRYQGDRVALADAEDVVLDFRETELGTLRFTASGKGELTVQVGESVPEVRDPDPKWFEQVALKPIALSAQPIAVVLPVRALRYARLEVKGNVQLSDIRFDARVHPAPALGRFETSDPALNAIWTTAVATLRSNMHEFYLDGIRRDGLVWHDGTQALEAFERVFFNADMSRQTLIAQTLPEQPSVRDFGIIDSQMYDVIGFEREYMLRGDARFSRMFRDRIEDSLQLYTSLQDSAGLLDAKRVKPYGFFPDWSAEKARGPDAKGSPVYGQMLLVGAFSAGARLAGAWGDDRLQAKWTDAAARLRSTLHGKFFDRQAGLYVNGNDSAGARDDRFTPFAQAFAIAYDVAPPAEHARLFAWLNDPQNRSPRWSLTQVVELTAYAKAGRTADGIARLKAVWLPLVERGYRRFFEDIRPAQGEVAQLAMYSRKYGNSLCHAWAGAAPVMLLSRGVLGVEPLAPGFSLCQVTPATAGIASGQGAVPTPQGLIEIEWSKGKGSVTLPAGIRARLADGREVSGPGRHALPSLPG